MSTFVYIAAPYTKPDPVENVRRVVRVADRLRRDRPNVVPIVPHLTMLWHMIQPHGIEFWYEYDLEILDRCDVLIRLDGESTGADREVEHANEIGLPVFDDARSLYEWIDARARAQGPTRDQPTMPIAPTPTYPKVQRA